MNVDLSKGLNEKWGKPFSNSILALAISGLELIIFVPFADIYLTFDFTIDKTRLLISEKIKQSFDPKRVFNPGKMYRGV